MSVYNEYSKLNEVILGISQKIFMQDELPAEMAIINRESLKQPLPFPLNEYEFIEVDSKSRKELGTNVLVIDLKTIVVQERHTELQSKLRENGFKVITIDFTNHANTHGAFRCVTCPLSRSVGFSVTQPNLW